MAFGLFASGAHANETYAPVVTIGPSEAPKKLVFVWRADEASRSMFQEYIQPVVQRTKQSKQISLTLAQQPTEGPTGFRGPGALLFCAESPARYALLAYEYLIFPFDIGRVSEQKVAGERSVYTNENLRRVFESNTIDLEKCVKAPRFKDQLVRFGVEANAGLLVLKGQSLPVVLWAGKRITPRDGQGLAELRRLAKEP
jgi:hypothetical protein